MAEPSDLRLHRADGQCVITAGSVVLFAYGESDVVMRNLAISALRRLGFTGRRVAAVMGLTENYVATLHAGAVRDGSAALVRRPAPGRPGKLADQDWADAAAWRAQGLTDTEIRQRLRVAHTTVAPRPGSQRTAERGRARPPRRFPASTTSTITSSLTRERNRSGKAGTTSAAGPRKAAPTPTSQRTTAAPCASSPASHPAWPAPCPWPWPS